MKPRTRRIALLTVVAGCLVVAGLVVANRSILRDHIEAWQFQLTRSTLEIGPRTRYDPARDLNGEDWFQLPWLFQLLADGGHRPVVYDSASVSDGEFGMAPYRVSMCEVPAILREQGYRVVEQHCPRPAYVVVGYPAVRRPDSDILLRLELQRLRGEVLTTLKESPR